MKSSMHRVNFSRLRGRHDKRKLHMFGAKSKTSESFPHAVAKRVKNCCECNFDIVESIYIPFP